MLIMITLLALVAVIVLGSLNEESAGTASQGSMASPLALDEMATDQQASALASQESATARGDLDCDGDIDSDDVLQDLLHAGALPVSAQQPCLAIGTVINPTFGDVDCDADADSVDALKIMRHIVAIPGKQSPLCPSIGSAFPFTPPIGTMAVDADTAGNTATSLSSRQRCRGGIPDGSIVDIDIIVDSIPASRPLQGFDFELTYNPERVEIVAVDDTMLLAAHTDSGPYVTETDPMPDTDGTLRIANTDTDLSAGETGPGVLARVSVRLDASDSFGLEVGNVLDSDGTDIPREFVFGGSLLVGSGPACLPPTGGSPY